MNCKILTVKSLIFNKIMKFSSVKLSHYMVWAVCYCQPPYIAATTTGTFAWAAATCLQQPNKIGLRQAIGEGSTAPHTPTTFKLYYMHVCSLCPEHFNTSNT